PCLIATQTKQAKKLMALRYTGDCHVAGSRAEILDLKNGTNATGSNPDMRTLAPGLLATVTDATGGAVQLTAVSNDQFAALAAQEDGDATWKRITYDIDTDTATALS
uniref:hypothetical protein n=1 Tax=uncultured Microscilla sp. TaxID=432653 RepID=UPI0026085C99